MTSEETNSLVLKIKTYLALINKDTIEIEQQHSGLIDFVIYEVLDRVMLFLNSETIPTVCERIIAEIVNGNLHRILDVKSDDGSDRMVSSMSDNGQSVSYSTSAKTYFASAGDDEIFGGYVDILKRYRKIKVVC